MPLYEFKCEDCDEQFEKLMRLSDKTTQVECPECGSRHTRKLLSAFGIQSGAGGRGPLSASTAACGPVG